MTHSVSDTPSSRVILDNIKKSVPFSQGVVLTTLPRGELQVAQPAKLPSWVARVYSEAVLMTDCMSWRAMMRQEPARPGECWSRSGFVQSSYWQRLMEPLGMTHAAVLPLAAPVMPGYPGAIHLFRTDKQGAFTESQLASAMSVVRAFEKSVAGSRPPGKSGRGGRDTNHSVSHPAASLTIFDSKLRPRLGGQEWRSADPHLKEQMLEHARRRMKQSHGKSKVSDRVQFPDSAGNVWTYGVVTYGQFPALKDGPFSFFCPQPACGEWAGIKVADFQANPELARLIPALQFMYRSYRSSPRLQNIARVTKLSPFHFHRRFAELLGITPKQFMLECQIHDAKAKLLGGKTELVDIARICGFSHQSHFTSRFKQITGQTPTRWRRNNVRKAD